MSDHNECLRVKMREQKGVLDTVTHYSVHSSSFLSRGGSGVEFAGQRVDMKDRLGYMK